MGIKYEITRTNSENEEENTILSNGIGEEFPTDKDFIYEVADHDIDERTIFMVYVVIKGKGKFKMNCKGKNKKLWYATIPLYRS